MPLALILGLILLLSLSTGAEPAPTSTTGLDYWIKTVVGYVAAGAEVASALVIGLALVRALLLYLRQLTGPHHATDATESVRVQLGRGLALGLEFTIASDILRTAVAPTREDIITLSAVVLLRTLLNYFLEREIRQLEARRQDPAPD